MFIDTHAHLTGEELLGTAEQLIARAKTAGVSKIINICTDEKSLVEGLALAKKYPDFIYNSAAVTPHDIDKFFLLVENCINQLVAIGETGLDYHYQGYNKEAQLAVLERYFFYAKKHCKPVVIHCREAFTDLFACADAHFANQKLVLHCFTGNLKEAYGLIERGYYLSLSGIVTFKNSIELQEVAKMIPLEKLLIETDSPYLAPIPYRGKSNEPAFVVETAKFIANLRGICVEELAVQTTKNAYQFFSLDKT